MSKKHILVVENDWSVANALNRALSSSEYGGYEVEISFSAEDAVNKLLVDGYNLLISDLNLPGMDGLDLLRTARQISPPTRRMLITTFDMSGARVQAHGLAHAYFIKPLPFQEFITRVQQLIKESRANGDFLERDKDAQTPCVREGNTERTDVLA